MCEQLRLENSPDVAVIDESDYVRVARYKWYLSPQGYVYGYFGNNRKRLLHRFLMNVTDPRVLVDHQDRNPLNCVRSNLRLCNYHLNAANQGKTKGGTSQFKGVSWSPRFNKWRSAITCNYRSIHVGYFEDEVEAAHAYDKRALECFGEFACLNFPECDYSQYSDGIQRRCTPSSSYPGVRLGPYNRWIARVNNDGQRKYIGCFDSEAEAIAACEKARGCLPCRQ